MIFQTAKWRGVSMVMVLLLLGCTQERKSTDAGGEKNRVFVAKKRSFDVTFAITGRLDVARRHQVRCPDGPIEFQVTELIRDRTEVKKGDIIAKFATDKLEAELIKTIESQSEEEKNLEIEKKEKELLMDLLAQTIKDACTDYRLAHTDLCLYAEKESVAKSDELQDALRKAIFAAHTAEETKEKLQKQLLATSAQDGAKRNQLSGQVAQAKNAAIEAQFRKKEAARALTKFKQQEFVVEVAKHRKEVQESLRKWQRAILSAKTRLRQQNLKIDNIDSKLIRIAATRTQLEELKTQMVLKAPVDGIVTIQCKRPDEVDAQGESQAVKLASRSTVAEIPDCSKFIIKAEAPEGHRPRISCGMKAVVTAKALPGWKSEARISKIAPTAIARHRWDPNSAKFYPIELTLTEVTDTRLTPGITLDMELIAQSVRDVIALPLECVELKKGVPHCNVQTATGVAERKVEIGEYSDHYVEVKGGVEIGEKILFIRERSDG
jgi:HlyD family secretion protein